MFLTWLIFQSVKRLRWTSTETIQIIQEIFDLVLWYGSWVSFRWIISSMQTVQMKVFTTPLTLTVNLFVVLHSFTTFLRLKLMT